MLIWILKSGVYRNSQHRSMNIYYLCNMLSQKEIVLITGSGGMVAQALVGQLIEEYEVRFLSTHQRNNQTFHWDIDKHYIDERVFDSVRHIIHLAGANVMAKRWTSEYKAEIFASRVKSADLLLEYLSKRKQNIQTFISASAIGFYGDETSERVFTEEDVKGEGFLSDVVLRWEQAADNFEKEAIASRVVKLRTGVVLSDKGGALKKMAAPIRFGLGAAAGSGKQYMPWIHIADLCAMYKFALDSEKVSGVYNAVAPQKINNKEFLGAIAQTLHKPFWMPNVPSFLFKIALGESAAVVLNGSHVSCEKIQHSGFDFQYQTLSNALINLFQRSPN